MDQTQKAYLQSIVHYVISCRRQGHFLPYRDYQIIEEWLEICDNPDNLLITLDELLPKFYEPFLSQNQPLPSLASIKRKVEAALKHSQKRRSVSSKESIDAPI